MLANVAQSLSRRLERTLALPVTETYNALATGVVDGMDLTKSAYAGFKLYELVPEVIEQAISGHLAPSFLPSHFGTAFRARNRVSFEMLRSRSHGISTN